METRDEIGALYGPSCIGASLFFFWTLDRVLDCGLVPKSVQSQHAWRFKNIFLSFIHAVIGAFWAVSCFYQDPKLAEDVITRYSRLSLSLVSFSVGYFIHDAFHMLMNHRHKDTFELLGHHFVVTICFSVSIFKFTYIGYAVVSLIVEINSVFLHFRQLMQVCGYKKTDSVYRLNSLINLATFICFRIALLGWMTRWILLHKDQVPLAYYTLGSVGLAIMVVMNIILFFRLISSDFGKRSRETSQKRS